MHCPRRPGKTPYRELARVKQNARNGESEVCGAGERGAGEENIILISPQTPSEYDKNFYAV